MVPQGADRVRVTLEEHEGSTIYSDSLSAPTPVLASVYVVMMPDGNVRYGASGNVGAQVAALALLCVNVPGLLEAVVGMKQLFDRRLGN